MSFHFPWVFPLIFDRSVWHNGKQPFSPGQKGWWVYPYEGVQPQMRPLWVKVEEFSSEHAKREQTWEMYTLIKRGDKRYGSKPLFSLGLLVSAVDKGKGVTCWQVHWRRVRRKEGKEVNILLVSHIIQWRAKALEDIKNESDYTSCYLTIYINDNLKIEVWDGCLCFLCKFEILYKLNGESSLLFGKASLIIEAAEINLVIFRVFCS